MFTCLGPVTTANGYESADPIRERELDDRIPNGDPDNPLTDLDKVPDQVSHVHQNPDAHVHQDKIADPNSDSHALDHALSDPVTHHDAEPDRLAVRDAFAVGVADSLDELESVSDPVTGAEACGACQERAASPHSRRSLLFQTITTNITRTGTPSQTAWRARVNATYCNFRASSSSSQPSDQPAGR